MYQYDSHDQSLVEKRALEFKYQVARRLRGELSEDEFKPLRLQNGLYLQLHAYMMRVAIPYGVIRGDQMKMLARIADKYDRGYGHFTTRQNIQFNWIKLTDVGDLLDDLASVQMHAIQTSGNCIRNVTTDAYAGVAADEWVDPRATAEFIRQWSTLHPEFSFLPRKFKIAIIGAAQDRAAMRFHDIGLRIRLDENNNIVYDVWVGGGQGRTPRISKPFRQNVSLGDLLPLLDSMIRVYNLAGRRDNKYKARIKILIDDLGVEEYARLVDEDLAEVDRIAFEGAEAEYHRIERYFTHRLAAQPLDMNMPPEYEKDGDFRAWVKQNVMAHKVAGYGAATISLKAKGAIAGDISSRQMYQVAELAALYSENEIRVTHRQNLVLPWVPLNALFELYTKLKAFNLAEANIGLTSDIIACPGLDYCALATARSIPVAQALSNMLREKEIAGHADKTTLNISGCINACAHHHIANIGILGLNRTEKETYQITLGGSSNENAAIGEVLGPGFDQDDIPDVVETILTTYENHKAENESFIETYARIGKQPFKEAVYG